MKVSIVIPTHHRPEKLKETIKGLRSQDFPTEDYEILVVDDGSVPAVTLDQDLVVSPTVRLFRLEGVERSAARNAGAKDARGELLIFVDDDISVQTDFIRVHWEAHQEFKDALIIGAIFLPEESQGTPFGRFRQRLEQDGTPTTRGRIPEKNFCAAANASISRQLFLDLGGFDPLITSSEDQDFAIRYSEKCGPIVFLPEARVLHRDDALDIRGYCRRNEWGSRLMRPFYQRYPDAPQNLEREMVNGFVRPVKEPLSHSFRKLLKSIISTKASVGLLFTFVDILERVAPESNLLDKTYRLLLGAHIFRGYRAAMRPKP